MADDDDDDLDADPAFAPSAQLFAELEKLPHVRGGKKKAWPLVAQAVANPDGFGVLDFAVENELVDSLDGEPAQFWTNPHDESEMVWIPGGKFYYGPLHQSKKDQWKRNSRTGRRERVVPDGTRPGPLVGTLPGFSLGRYPITTQQFLRFIDEAGYEPPTNEPLELRELFFNHWTTRGKRHMDEPAVFVSFLDALAYCRWAGLMLPTEWQWEKAARGIDGRAYPWGDASPGRGNVANIGGDSLMAVTKFEQTRSPYGCSDLVGNASEWCYQTTGDDPTGAVLDPTQNIDYLRQQGPRTAVRGACFLRRTTKRTVAAHRRVLWVARRNRWTGFRPMFPAPCKPAA